MIEYNPIYKKNGSLNGAITTAPSSSLVFDLAGKAIWAKGVKLKGTDHTYTFSHDNYITLTNTPGSDESEDIKIGVDITTLKTAIDTTYSVVTASYNGLAPAFSSGNKASASANTTYHFLGLAGNTLKWYELPYKNVYVESTEVQSISNTDPLKFSAGNGINITWDSTNKKIVITNSSPDVNHNTDSKVAQALTSTNYDYPIILKGSNNLNENTTNVNFSQYLSFNPSTKLLKVNGQTVIHTGNITSSNATIGETLTTIASFEGVEVKAKVDYSNIIPSYLSQWDISVDKASLELTREWTDSGISLQSLSPGPCLLYINYCGVHYSGTFSYAGTTINTDDEFPLHESGYRQLERGRIFAKIAAVSGVAKLMLSASVPESNIPLFTIKIKQIAKL